jgi:hypothetical protein
MGGISILSKGLEVNKIKAKKENSIIVCTPMIEDNKLKSILTLFLEIKYVKKDKIKTHSIREPS